MIEDDEFYVCVVCGYEDDPDKFGRFCQNCGCDLDEEELVYGGESKNE